MIPNHGDRNLILSRTIVGSLVLAFLLFLLLIAYAPDSVAFSPNNYGWNGIHDVFSAYGMHPISLTDNLPSGENRSVLVEIQPVVPFSSLDALFIRNFVEHGGTLVIADNIGTSNSLLGQMGVSVQIESNLTVNDPVYNWKAPALPTAIVLHSASLKSGVLSHVMGIAMDEPSPLSLSPGTSVVVASSSPQSFAANRSQLLGSANPLQLLNGGSTGGLQPVAKGPFPLAAEQTLGNGTVFVFGDSQFFTNSIWQIANNKVLTGNLFSNSSVYLDTSHWQVNTEGVVKAELFSIYALISESPLNYLATLGFVGAALLILPVFPFPASGEKKISNVADDSSAFNAEIMARIRRDREKHGIR